MASRADIANFVCLLFWLVVWFYTVGSMYYTDTYITTTNARKIKPQFLHSTLHTQELKPGTGHAVKTAYLVLDSYMQQDTQTVEYPVLSTNACFSSNDHYINKHTCHPLLIHSAAVCPHSGQQVDKTSDAWETVHRDSGKEDLGYGTETINDGTIYAISPGMQRVCQHERIGEMRVMHNNIGTYGFAGTRDLRIELYGITSLVVLLLLARILVERAYSDESHLKTLYDSPLIILTILFAVQIAVLLFKPYYADEVHHDISTEGAFVQEHALIGTASVFYVTMALTLTWIWLILGKHFCCMDTGEVATATPSEQIKPPDNNVNGTTALEFNTDYLFVKNKHTDAYALMRHRDKTSVYREIHTNELRMQEWENVVTQITSTKLTESVSDLSEVTLTTSLLVLTFMIPQAYTLDVQFQYKFILSLSFAILVFAYRRACKLINITSIIISHDTEPPKFKSPNTLFKTLILGIIAYLWVIILLQLIQTSRAQASTHVSTTEADDYDNKPNSAFFIVLWAIFLLVCVMRESFHVFMNSLAQYSTAILSVFCLLWVAALCSRLVQDEHAWINIIKYFENTDRFAKDEIPPVHKHALLQLIWKFQEPVL